MVANCARARSTVERRAVRAHRAIASSGGSCQRAADGTNRPKGMTRAVRAARENRVRARRAVRDRGRQGDRRARQARRRARTVTIARSRSARRSSSRSSRSSPPGRASRRRSGEPSRPSTLAEASATRTKANRQFQESLTYRAGDATTFNAWFAAYIAGDQEAVRGRGEALPAGVQGRVRRLDRNRPVREPRRPAGTAGDARVQADRPGGAPEAGRRGRRALRGRARGGRDRRQLRAHDRHPRERALPRRASARSFRCAAFATG